MPTKKSPPKTTSVQPKKSADTPKNPVTAPSFSPISDLFRNALSKLKPPIRHLIGLEVLQLIVMIILGTTIVINLFIALGLSVAELQNVRTEQDMAAYFMQFLFRPQTWAIAGLFALITSILVSMISAFFSAAYVIRLDRSHTGFPFKQLLREALNLTPKVFLTLLISSIVIIGAFGFFLLPGIIVSILLAFTLYEVILERQSITQAIRASYTIVTTHFVDLLLRAIALIAAVGILIYILETLTTNSGNFNPFFELITSLIGVVINWFVLAYAIIVYREARAQTNLSVTKNPAWIYLISAIGWIFLVFLGAFAWRASETLLQNLDQIVPGLNQETLQQPSFWQQFEEMSPEETEQLQQFDLNEMMNEDGEINEAEFEEWIQQFEATETENEPVE